MTKSRHHGQCHTFDDACVLAPSGEVQRRCLLRLWALFERILISHGRYLLRLQSLFERTLISQRRYLLRFRALFERILISQRMHVLRPRVELDVNTFLDEAPV